MVPGIVIVFVACCILFICPDTPTGKWSARIEAAQSNLQDHGVQANVVNASKEEEHGTTSSPSTISDEEKKQPEGFADHEAHLTSQEMVDVAQGQIIEKPTWKDTIAVMSSPQTLTTGVSTNIPLLFDFS